MESPIEVVRRFCAAWSDNMGAVELAAFFAEDAIYHNIPQERSPAGRTSPTRSLRSCALARQASRASISASSTSQPMARS
jgi:limonene-1,2-epoxide hydrolase